MLLQAVAATIDRHQMLAPGQTVLVAVSGGPDSLALLDLLARLAGDRRLTLAVAHLDHGLRPDSAADADFVAASAAARGLPCVRERVDLPALLRGSGAAPEALAREVRYAFLARAAAAVGADRVALGHNADDQAETVIMRLLRGAGTDGLAGIPPVRLPYVRPLLETPRSAIEEYCRARGLLPRHDVTNADPAYLRNRLRHELLPLLRSYNPRLTESLGELGERLRDEAQYLRQVALTLLATLTADGDGLDCAGLAASPTALQRAALRAYYERETGALAPAYHHIERLRELAAGRDGGQHQLPGHLLARREYGRLVIVAAEAEPAAFELTLSLPGLTELPTGEAIAVWLTDPGACAFATTNEKRLAYVDSAALAGAVVRTRRPGDRIRITGVGEKKLQDLLVDAKLPRRLRDRLPLLAIGGDILWVPGQRVSEVAAVTPATRQVAALRLLPAEWSHCSDPRCMLE